MEQAIAKADALIEALEYIRRFHNKIVVVKLGGSILDNPEMQQELLTDIVFMATVGMRPILIHGGGKAITQAMNEAGLEPQWVHGRRYTDERTLKIAEHTLVHKINTPICNTIRSLGFRAMGLHTLSSCVIGAEPLRLENGEGRKIDLGLVGKMTDVNAELLQVLCEAGVIPVIAPIARTRTGGKLNVNADSVAGMVAASVKAEKLVVLSDTNGIRRDVNDPNSYLSSATGKEIEQMIKDGIITSGMMPKVESCLTALSGGAAKAHIIDGRIAHSLLLEIYTDKGIGTQILK
jgi:acetylglutamate kinase